MNDQDNGSGGSFINLRFLVALAIAAFSLFAYFSNTSFNPVTNQKQHLDMTADQEIALGVQSAPEMENQYGGEANDITGQARVTRIGESIVSQSDAGKTPYSYKFHLLADPKTINAFALPGGQVFITEGLYKHIETDGELACVLGHEIGHVVARHSAQQLAKQQLTQGLTGAAVIAAYDPNDRNSSAKAEMAMLIGQVVSLKFGRNDELEADKLGVRFSSDAGYDPRAMDKVMEILDRLAKSRTPEFFSTHPNPEHRIERIDEAIKAKYPDGVPSGLVQ
ncbi:MAG: M48 family metalloprotease [Cyanobacteria bacterium REEB67]|nr:M48 family metalloprotease [Cyanobacteria bacterium REEB67]